MSEKLIRDLIPSLPNPQFISMQTRRVSNMIEHIFFLQEKEKEEYGEFLGARTYDECSFEAADYLEVLDTLLYFYEQNQDTSSYKLTLKNREDFLERLMTDYEFDIEYIFRLQQQKREKKGGFLEGIIWLKD